MLSRPYIKSRITKIWNSKSLKIANWKPFAIATNEWNENKHKLVNSTSGEKLEGSVKIQENVWLIGWRWSISSWPKVAILKVIASHWVVKIKI